MAGLLDFNTGDDDTKLATAYGITPEQMGAQRMSSLGQIGSILLAAAQAGPIGQRGQMLAQLSNVSGDASKGMLNAAQARLMGSKVREAGEDETRRSTVRDMVGKLDLSPEQRAWAIANPDQFLQSRGQGALNLDQEKVMMAARNAAALQQARDMGPVNAANAVTMRQATDPLDVAKQGQTTSQAADAPFAAKVRQLTASGMSPEMAAGIASGRYVVKNEDGQVAVIDISTGQPVGGSARTTLNEAQQKIMSGMPTTGAGGKPLDYSEATGGSGLFKGGLNIIGGNIGGATPYPDANTATDALDSLRTRTMTQLTAAIPGRETNAMREQLGALAVKPGSLMQPDTMARTKLEQTRGLIDSEMSKLTAQLEGGGLTGAQRGQVRQNILQLKSLSQDYGVVLEHFGASSASAPFATARDAPAAAGGGAAPQFKILGVR